LRDVRHTLALPYANCRLLCCETLLFAAVFIVPGATRGTLALMCCNVELKVWGFLRARIYVDIWNQTLFCNRAKIRGIENSILKFAYLIIQIFLPLTETFYSASKVCTFLLCFLTLRSCLKCLSIIIQFNSIKFSYNKSKFVNITININFQK
jgi:hypothetical protein